jgi:GNAT superfamily N-acetyltransferase
VIKPAGMGESLANHYGDLPLRALPRCAVLALAARWRKRPDVFYAEARDADDQFLGFVLAQTVGPRPWRTLLARPFWIYLWAIGIFAAQRLCRKKQSALPSQSTEPCYHDAFPASFRHMGSSGEHARIEYIFVEPAARGRKVAQTLFKAAEGELRASGATGVFAHIARHNASSIRAFQSAEYAISSEGPGSLQAFKVLREAGQ